MFDKLPKELFFRIVNELTLRETVILASTCKFCNLELKEMIREYFFEHYMFLNEIYSTIQNNLENEAYIHVIKFKGLLTNIIFKARFPKPNKIIIEKYLKKENDDKVRKLITQDIYYPQTYTNTKKILNQACLDNNDVMNTAFYPNRKKYKYVSCVTTSNF